MSVASPTKPVPAWRPYLKAIIPLSLLAAAVIILQPDLSLLADTSPAIKIHLTAAVAALTLGAVMMASRKGAWFHRRAGWTWVTIMAVVAISSLFITEISPGRFSFIHGFTALTLISLPMGVLAAKRHNVKAHRGTMMGMFFGGLIIAGLFTFLPGRLLFEMFFGK